MRTKLREMIPADLPALHEKLREQNLRDGTDFPFPEIFDNRGKRLARIPLALVAVDEITGEVVQGHIWEQTLEQSCIGTDPEATVCSMHEQEAVYFLLRNRGFQDVHLFVPMIRAEEIEHGLDRILRLKYTGNSLKHFYRRLDPNENEIMRQWYEEHEVTA